MAMSTQEARADPLGFVVSGLKATFGMGTAREQMVWSVVLALVAYLTSLISFGVTLLFAALFTLTFIWGAVRLVYGWVMAMRGGG